VAAAAGCYRGAAFSLGGADAGDELADALWAAAAGQLDKASFAAALQGLLAADAPGREQEQERGDAPGPQPGRSGRLPVERLCRWQGAARPAAWAPRGHLSGRDTGGGPDQCSFSQQLPSTSSASLWEGAMDEHSGSLPGVVLSRVGSGPLPGKLGLGGGRQGVLAAARCEEGLAIAFLLVKALVAQQGQQPQQQGQGRAERQRLDGCSRALLLGAEFRSALRQQLQRRGVASLFTTAALQMLQVALRTCGPQSAAAADFCRGDLPQVLLQAFSLRSTRLQPQAAGEQATTAALNTLLVIFNELWDCGLESQSRHCADDDAPLSSSAGSLLPRVGGTVPPAGGPSGQRPLRAAGGAVAAGRLTGPGATELRAQASPPPHPPLCPPRWAPPATPPATACSCTAGARPRAAAAPALRPCPRPQRRRP
jgi:hypothetical protein